MSADPRVTVIMPVYNSERYASRAVDSILSQTFRDFEFIIINDGSTDRSLEILKRYAEQDSRIRLLSRPNTGIVKALNEGLMESKGDFIARMDSDDIALPHRFERQMNYLDAHPECVMVGSRVIIIDPDDQPLTVMGEALTHEEVDSSMMASRGQIIYHPAVIFRKEPLLRVGPFREEYISAEDLDIFLRLAEIGKVINLAEPLLKYREHMSKVGNVRADEQNAATLRVLKAAYERRGQEIPDEILQKTSKSLTAGERRRGWAWWALMAGNARTARKHAFSCFLEEPFLLENWKLMYCSIRGY